MNESQPSITQDVSVRNIDIEFWTLVWLLVKFAFAAIPASIIIVTISGILWGLFFGMMSSF
tara:strand:- start:80 stop:262 length:183 start_codon:yes stop_codon:yes gene_type:complete